MYEFIILFYDFINLLNTLIYLFLLHVIDINTNLTCIYFKYLQRINILEKQLLSLWKIFVILILDFKLSDKSVLVLQLCTLLYFIIQQIICLWTNLPCQWNPVEVLEQRILWIENSLYIVVSMSYFLILSVVSLSIMKNSMEFLYFY